MRIHVPLFVLVAGMPFAAGATALPCEEAYYSPDDIKHERPLLEPSAGFLKSYELARAGKAMAQRNIAVSYDAGYLVAACPEKARYWYRKAADSGDQVAQKWVARDDKLQEISDGPEFVYVSHDTKPEKLASAASGRKDAAGTKVAVARSGGARTAEQMLADVADITRPPDASSDMGKMIEVGRLLGSVIAGH